MKFALLAPIVLATSVVYTGAPPAAVIVRSVRCSHGARTPASGSRSEVQGLDLLVAPSL